MQIKYQASEPELNFFEKGIYLMLRKKFLNG